MTRLDLDRLRSDLMQHAEAVALALLGKPATRSRGELRDGRKGSLAIALAGKPAGLWRDRETGTGGDLLALIQRERSCDFPAAVATASEILSDRYTVADAPRRDPPRELEPEQKRDRALALFEAAQPIGGSRAERYLVETRGIVLADLPSDLERVLRYHPNCPFGPDRREACLLALFRDIESDRPQAIQRIAIDRDLKKIGSLSLGPTRNAAIKIYDHVAITSGLCIAEGLETALSGPTIQYHSTVLAPIWATGGSETMRAFPVLPAIEALTILVDHDRLNAKTGERPGEAAARACAQRWRATGRDVLRLMPDRLGEDFNDVVRGGA
jgi:putative DNA primase/helicase